MGCSINLWVDHHPTHHTLRLYDHEFRYQVQSAPSFLRTPYQGLRSFIYLLISSMCILPLYAGTYVGAPIHRNHAWLYVWMGHSFSFVHNFIFFLTLVAHHHSPYLILFELKVLTLWSISLNDYSCSLFKLFMINSVTLFDAFSLKCQRLYSMKLTTQWLKLFWISAANTPHYFSLIIISAYYD